MEYDFKTLLNVGQKGSGGLLAVLVAVTIIMATNSYYEWGFWVVISGTVLTFIILGVSSLIKMRRSSKNKEQKQDETPMKDFLEHSFFDKMSNWIYEYKNNLETATTKREYIVYSFLLCKLEVVLEEVKKYFETIKKTKENFNTSELKQILVESIDKYEQKAIKTKDVPEEFVKLFTEHHYPAVRTLLNRLDEIKKYDFVYKGEFTKGWVALDELNNVFFRTFSEINEILKLNGRLSKAIGEQEL